MEQGTYIISREVGVGVSTVANQDISTLGSLNDYSGHDSHLYKYLEDGV